MRLRAASLAILSLIFAPGPGASQSQDDLAAALETLGYGRPFLETDAPFDFELAVRQYQAAKLAAITGQLSRPQIQALLEESVVRQEDIESEMALMDEADVPAPVDPDAILERVNAYIREEARRVTEAGLVYRSPLYWDSYSSALDISAVFDGDFAKMNRDSYGFAMLFNAYVVAYSRVCEDSLPMGSAVYRFTQRRQTFDGWGFRTADYTIPVDRVVVDRAMQPHYDRFSNHPASPAREVGGFGQVLNMLDGSATGSLTSLERQASRFFVGPQADFTRFLEREGCRSAPQVQMQTNLLRHASAQKSVQDRGDRFDQLPTETASDGGQLTLVQMPLALRLHAQIAGFGDPGNRPMPANPIDDPLHWAGMEFETYLDGVTEAMRIVSNGREIGWRDVLSLYNLQNRDLLERERFSPVFFKDDAGIMHVAHMRIGWSGEGVRTEVERVTFTIRRLACAAYRAGRVTWGREGPQGDNGFSLVVQPNYGAGRLNLGSGLQPVCAAKF